MRVSDETKLYIIRKKLLEAERSIYEANKIIASLGEFDRDPIMGMDCDSVDNNFNISNVTKLYPGQLRNPEMEDNDECET